MNFETMNDDQLTFSCDSLETLDPEIFQAINQERGRQQDHIELIASENFTFPAVLEATGSVMTNKYAEGYPRKRYYGGCEFVDIAEQLAIDRAKELFGADHANVQPHAGSQANIAVYFAALNPGDKLLSMRLDHGGHLTHGHPKNMSGDYFEVASYGVDIETGLINYDEIEQLAAQEKPKIITVGASAYSREIDFERMAHIAKSCSALLLADIAHIAGLVAAKEHPSPVGLADFITTTTHKTLRGPRGGLILCKEEHAKAVDSALFPGTQGGSLMHVIAAKAVCFGEALKPEFKSYQQQIKKNAKALAQSLMDKGYDICSGGTDNHLMLIDLRKTHPDISGKNAQIALDKANITTNRNTIPGDERSPFQTSGIRIGTPAITTRGMIEKDMAIVADFIHNVLKNITDDSVISQIQQQVASFSKEFPLPY